MTGAQSARWPSSSGELCAIELIAPINQPKEIAMNLSFLAAIHPSMPFLADYIWIGGGGVGLVVLIVVIVLILR
jgi:hypothetical protein